MCHLSEPVKLIIIHLKCNFKIFGQRRQYVYTNKFDVKSTVKSH